MVPPDITVLSDAERIDDTYDPDSGTVTVEASGLHTVTVSDIVARHGEVSLLPESERNFRAAFVVLSREPVPDALLSEVGHWSAAFGNRVDDDELRPFEALTGNLATLDTTLGPRRSAADPAPTVRPEFACDLIEQDCGEGIGCYLNGQRSFCAISGGLERDALCEESFDCSVGSECVSGTTTPTNRYCEPFCDPDASSPIACGTVCTDYILLGRPDGSLLVGRCKGP
jgi:hypothetical protein